MKIYFMESSAITLQLWTTTGEYHLQRGVHCACYYEYVLTLSACNEFHFS